MYFDDISAGILISETRYRAVRITPPHVDFLFIAFHAPRSSDMDKCTKWWHHCISQTLQVKQSHPDLSILFLIGSIARPPTHDGFSLVPPSMDVVARDQDAMAIRQRGQASVIALG